MNTVPGYILMGLVGVGVAISGAAVDSRLPLLIAFGMAGLLFTIACFYYPRLGFYTSLLSSAFLTMPDRLFTTSIPVPLGMVIEAIEYVTLLSILAREYRVRTNTSPFWRNPLTIAFVVLLVYYISDIFNPVPHSSLGWFNYVRKQFSFFAFYYMTYILMDSYKAITQFLKIWLAFTLFIALYGIKQQWFGLADFESNWLMRNPEVYNLSFQSGFLRKFSVLNDAAAFGVLCASMLVFTLVLAARTESKKRRWQLLLASLAFFLGSSYSGTRSCNLMIVMGILAYTIFTLNEKRTYTILVYIILVGGFILYGPFKNNPVVARINSTFSGNKDPSAMLRSINRHAVQPYLQAHPMGGGIYTCGAEGSVYNDGHYLSKFQPDSGYMKILAEQGWVGLILILIFYFIFMRTGMKGFFHAVNPQVKSLYLALTALLFSLLAGQFSQVALAQYPTILFYFAALTILYKLKDYDTSNSETTINTKEPA
ncbi:MAG TPA: O-antigen ligase family protein [Chitinophagaceae bacterium]